MDDFEWLLEEAAALNEYEPPAHAPAAQQGNVHASTTATGERPGDLFNQRASWDDILPLYGWKAIWKSTKATYWRRPGKTGPGCSATTGYCKSALRGDLLHVFSTNAAPLEADETYSKFEVYAILGYNRDWSAAARDLGEKGYRLEGPTLLRNGRAPGTEKPDAENGSQQVSRWPLPIPASQLRRRPANEKWLWSGYLSRGGFTLFSALWKIGKTTLLAHMLHAFECDGRFCGLDIKGSRVLYISEEDEDTWAERRDELNLKDHLEFMPRPFRGRPTLPEWVSFLAHLSLLCQERKFDLVVFDTVSKLWPVRDENDATQVENALVPLYCLTDQDCAVLIVHHMRKSDGEQLTGSRGSGGLPAFVETIMELRRFESANLKDTRRVITARGRFRETPDELVVTLDPARGYIPLGEKKTIRRAETMANLLEALPSEPPGINQETIAALLEMAKKTLLPLLDRALLENRIGRSGSGKSGSQFLYWKKDAQETSRSEPGPTEDEPPQAKKSLERSPALGSKKETDISGASDAKEWLNGRIVEGPQLLKTLLEQWAEVCSLPELLHQARADLGAVEFEEHGYTYWQYLPPEDEAPERGDY